MIMSAVDTNVLLRLLVDDPGNKKQCTIARKWASELEETLYISQIIQVELVWVLKKAYEFPKENILLVLQTLNTNGAFELQRSDIFKSALSYYKLNNVDFSDAIILSEAESSMLTPLVTFDKKLGKLNNTVLLA
jgi:predicted nucleic-acid-binding protein